MDHAALFSHSQVLHSEIQQYKVQVDQLTQLTDRLVASYPHDDTRRAVRTNDNIAQRYSALDAGYSSQLLHPFPALVEDS